MFGSTTYWLGSMTLNECIIESTDREADAGFFRRFSNSDVFSSVDATAIAACRGSLDAPSGMGLRLQIANIDLGRIGLFYTSMDDVRLGEEFTGMPLIRAAQTVCDLPEVDGMLIQSDGDAWVIARKEALREVIGQVRDDVFYKDFSKPPAAS
ncbi:hypothetical protein EER27_04300 [Lysobacter psychrotolerans]|uniref:Uncharacterized protein n=2 Tax=Montanilutibacter psychrotolerans TaxID=1327343 RepID=A0A3M8SUL5_9GAMM|nr:hypothetical protein EER27_04300 [Lysobacter psychrotolerans]